GPALLRRPQRARDRASARMPAGNCEVPTVARTRPVAQHPRRGRDAMIDLERELSELADHLDYPTSADRAEALRQRIRADGEVLPHWIGRTRRARALLVAAAVLMLAAAGVVAIAPARHAVADWLGIGA